MVPIAKELIVQLALEEGLVVCQCAIIVFQAWVAKSWGPTNLLKVLIFLLGRGAIGASVGRGGAGDDAVFAGRRQVVAGIDTVVSITD